MRIAVVGGGLFGTTIASALAQAGHDVSLFERMPNILRGASGVNQSRLHRGYHYPRSAETITSLLEGEPLFADVYGGAIVPGTTHYYAIAADTRTTAGDFLAMCDAFSLEYSIEEPDVFAAGEIEVCVRVREASLDLDRLRALCWAGLSQGCVDVRLSTSFTAEDSKEFDHIVVSCYAGNNQVLRDLDLDTVDYRYKTCELAVAALPAPLRDTSFVIMDGRFPSFDPLPHTGLHVLGHVDAMHHTDTVGREAEVPEWFDSVADGDWHPPGAMTVFPAIVRATSRFVPLVAQARHVASMFTVRAVLPDVADTDERPTVVASSGSVTSIFAGKLTTCVATAREVTSRIAGLQA